MAAEDAKPSLLDQARLAIAAKGPRCTVAQTIADHPDLAGEIQELLDATPRIPYATASSILGGADIHLKAETLSRHKRGECACP